MVQREPERLTLSSSAMSSMLDRAAHGAGALVSLNHTEPATQARDSIECSSPCTPHTGKA